jgi:hypothetical protein
VELSSDEKVIAAKEQGRAQAASELNALQEELQRLQLRRSADADAARKVQLPPKPFFRRVPPVCFFFEAKRRLFSSHCFVVQAAVAAEDLHAELQSTIASMRM